MNAFLCAFSPETYQAFTQAGCTTMGFAAEERARVLALRPGDRLCCFMTRLWRWVGVLEVAGSAYEEQGPLFYKRDDPFVVRVKVRPLVWLEAQRSVPFQEMPTWERLACVAGHSRQSMTWKQLFLRGLEPVSAADAETVLESVRTQSVQPREYAFDAARYRKFLRHRTRSQSWLTRLRRRVSYSPGVLDALAAMACGVIRGYFRTLRVEHVVAPAAQPLDRRRAVFAFWHGRQFLLVPSFGSSGAVLMTDWSWLGELQTRIVQRFGYVAVRGASERQGARGLLTLKKAVENGAIAALAVDGPAGPIHASKPGILLLAAKLGYPIVPVASSARRAWVLRGTWCRYLLPMPFTRCVVAVGPPLAEAATGGLTSADLDRALCAWTEETDRRCGRTPDAQETAGPRSGSMTSISANCRKSVSAV